MNFNIRQLEAFYWIVRLGGFGVAAQKLGATQPTVSARIKELEQALGTSLFQRGNKLLHPTPAARALYPLAEEVLAGIARIESKIRTNEIASGAVRIGIGEIVAETWFPDFLAKLHTDYPSIQLHINVDLTTVLLRMLEEGRIDLAIVSTPGAAGLFADSLGSTPLRWMASKALVPSAKKLGPEELAGFPIYALHRNLQLPTSMMKWFQSHGVRPALVHNCNSLSVIIKLVKLGCGIALVPPVLVRNELERGDLRIIAPHSKQHSTEFFLVRYPDVIDPTILRIAEMIVQRTTSDGKIAN